MAIERFEPAGLFSSKPFGFSQVVRAEGTRVIHCAGQTAWDGDMTIIGEGDLAFQMQATLANVETALEAAGATRRDVVSLRIYVVDYDPNALPVIGEALTEFFGEDHLPANTLLGIDKLALPEFMVEIEAVAIL